MQHHRLRHLAGLTGQPQSAPPTLTPSGFMVCPVVLVQGLSVAQQQWQCALYQLAYEQAQAEQRPSLPERDLLAVWN